MDWTRELQMYLQIDTSRPHINHNKAIDFLIGVVSRMASNLYYRVYNKHHVLVVSKLGKTNRSILLATHIDVQSVVSVERWSYPPFAGHYDPTTDRIYGRGAQDNKSQAIQYLALLHHLHDHLFEYTIHVCFLPGGGGNAAAGDFFRSPQFRALGVQMVVNGGCPSPFEHFLLYYAERTVWEFMIRIRSEGRHIMDIGRRPTCEHKLQLLLDEVAKFRMRDHHINMTKSREYNIGYLTSVHMMGITMHTIPPSAPGSLPPVMDVLPREIAVTFKMCIGLETSMSAVLEEIQRWTVVANGPEKPMDKSVTLEWIRCANKTHETDTRNPLFGKFVSFMQSNKIPYALSISPDASDCKVLRDEGIPVIGFSPINRTPQLLYADDEFIYRKQFLDNIHLMANLIKYLAN